MITKLSQTTFLNKATFRRQFLKTAGMTIAGAAFISASSCSKSPVKKSVNIYDAGTGDTGVLNFLYANEQLLAAFYIAVFTTPYSNMAGEELKYLNDIHDHDITHRDFLQEFLGQKGYPTLTFDFSSVDFTNRTSVLSTAKVVKNNSIAAYNSVAYLLKDADYLTVLGKIASVEGRHSATIGNLINYGELLDSMSVDSSTSLEIAKSPADVLMVINSYLKSKITANNL